MHDLYYGGLCSWAAKNGGTTYPINLPSEDTEETGQMNPSILISNNRILFNIRQVNYALYHSEGKRFPHLWGALCSTFIQKMTSHSPQKIMFVN